MKRLAIGTSASGRCLSRWRRRAGLVTLVLVGSATRSSSASATNLPPKTTDEVSLRSVPDVRVVLIAPTHAVYDPQALGVSGQFVTIRVTNDGRRPVALPSLHAVFTATREGVAFPCNERAPNVRGSLEPSTLGAGQSFDFERLLDCRMPLPGKYEVRTWVATADPRDRTVLAGAGEYVGGFEIDVGARDDASPKAVPTTSGLFAIMTGAGEAPPLMPDRWSQGTAYQVAVGLINGGAASLELPAAQLSLLLYKEGSPYPCSQAAVPLDVPSELAPGATYVTHVAVRCTPPAEGRYLIVGSLSAPGIENLPIGRVALQVTGYLYLLAPSGRERR
jgi:hypothetical protein